jgi:hypothetical protein
MAAFARLDKTSKTTIGRFLLKLVIGLVIARMVDGNYLALVSRWLSFYALFAAASAFLRRQPVSAQSFTGWDEALWLVFIASALDIVAPPLA